MILVMEPGSTVVMNESIRGTILAVTLLQGGTIQYTVAWWSGVDRNESVLSDCEVQLEDPNDHIPLGFHSISHGEDSSPQRGPDGGMR